MQTARRVAGGMDPDELIDFVVWVERQGGHVVKWLPLISGVCYALPAGKAVIRAMRVGTWDEQDVRVYALGNTTSQADTITPSWNLSMIQAPALWSRTQGQGVNVAIVDTGVDLTNPGFHHLAAGYNVVDPGTSPQDDNGHGTHVAGIVAGQWSGGSGVAPEAAIVPVKVLDASGSGSLSDVVDGLNWCLQQKLPIINMSLGAPQGTSTMHAAVTALAASGLIVMAAAGNEGPQPNTVSFPAQWPETIAVAASTQADRIAEFSSRGPQVDITAPGQSITSLWLGGGTKVLSGTSMATPHLSGGAALLLALAQKNGRPWQPTEVRKGLMDTCRVLPNYNAEAQGNGLLQLASAAIAVFGNTQ